MVTKTECPHCHRDTRTPFKIDEHLYCTKQCFYDHMTFLSDANIVQQIHREGTDNLTKKERRHMIRLNLLEYCKNAKAFILTGNAQKIMDNELYARC